MSDEGVTGGMEDKRFKVIHIIGGGEFGGAEQHILSLMEFFSSKPGMDAQVATFYDGLLADTLRQRGKTVHIIPQAGRFDVKLYARLQSLFREERPDIIHTHGVRANFFSRLAGRKAKGSHIVTTVHSILKHDYPKPGEYFMAHWMERVTLSMSNHFIAVSGAVKEDLIRFGVAKNKITVIHNGIPVESYLPSPILDEERKKVREGWGIPEEAILLLTVARLVPVKGLEDLIEGFSIAAKADLRLILLIVGDGPEREALERMARERGVAEKVLFAGFRQEIPAYLAAADIYLNTSISEGLPLSLMEAMAAGKPVIVTEVGGMKEMIENGRTGFFIPPKSSEEVSKRILHLAEDEMLRHTLGEKARTHAISHFSVEAMGEATYQLYQSILRG